MTSSENGSASASSQRPDGSTTERVVVQVREMIRQGHLRPGDQLPPEREFAKRLGISRSSLRPGLRFLAAMGILNSRHGSGTFIADRPPSLESEPLKFLAALERFTPDEMFETRGLIEVGIAGLAAERASDDHLATMADELTEMYATLDDPQQNLIHDIRFHRAVANSSGNPILAALMDMLSTAVYERRRLTVSQATDLKESARMHRRIYRSIRARNAAEARSAMSEHLNVAQSAFASQEISKPIDSDPKGKGSTAVRSDPPASAGRSNTLLRGGSANSRRRV